jgi:putative membrane protein
MMQRTGRWTIGAVVSIMLCVAPAQAHGTEGLWAGPLWTFDPWVMVPMYAFGVAYWLGTVRLWRRAGFGHGISMPQSACFWAGWLALAVALVSPLHWLGDRLFVAHMAEHCVLIAIAAPLLVVARPTAALLWAMPGPAGSGFVALAHWRPVAAAWKELTRPLPATLLHGAVVWLWHTPALYQAALDSVAWHRIEHLTFTLTAILFWWSLVRGRHQALKVACLFVTMLHCGLLGLLLTLSPRIWYPAQTALAADWDLTPLQDQQLAGLVMWVPTGAIYTIAALYFAAVWIDTSSGARRRQCPQVYAADE